MIIFLSGLVAGLIHVASGPDHLAAVAPFSVEGRKRAWSTGLRWGLGHSSGVAVIAGLGFLLREQLDIQGISNWSERFVGVLLIGIGLWGLRRTLTGKLHSHSHRHAGVEHAHVHAHPDGQPSAPAAHVHAHTAFAIGTLHGFAGSAHFLGVVPALALPTGLDSAIYVLGFALGTVVAMVGFSSAIGFWSASGNSTIRPRKLLGAASIASIAVGIAWLATS
jgi:sulfite exporter TauE/SafE